MISNTGLTKKASRKRILWMDILNICACLGVLLLHSNHQAKSFTGEITKSWLFGILVYTFFLWPVPVFFMLSGCNLLNSKLGGVMFLYRRFRRIGIPFIVWSIFYLLQNILIYNKSYTWREFLNCFMTGGFNAHMWFFIPLFSIYLSVPFLRCMLKGASIKTLYLFVLMGFIFTSLLPQIFELLQLNYFQMEWNKGMFTIAGNYIYIAVLGWLLGNTDINKQKRICLYIVAFFTLCFHFFMLYYKTIQDGTFYWSEHNYMYPANVIIPAAVFVFFKYTKFDNIFKRIRFISVESFALLSSCSFGIYLLHRFVHNIGFMFNIPFTHHIYGFIFTYCTCLCIILIMKKIPVIKYIVP